jgi:hypothetical protein
MSAYVIPASPSSLALREKAYINVTTNKLAASMTTIDKSRDARERAGEKVEMTEKRGC